MSANGVCIPKFPLLFSQEGQFRILTVSDLHETCDPDPRSLALLEGLVEKEKPDLVTLGGDNYNADAASTPEDLRRYLTKITAPMETRGIPWAHIFGNHDHDAPFDGHEMQAVYEQFPHCVSGHTDESVDGISNFALPIRSHDGSRIAFCVYGLDTHNLSDGLHLRNGVNLRREQAVAHRVTGTSHWDFVHFNQMRWYFDTSLALEQANGAPIDAMLLMHTPPLEYGICMANPTETKLRGDAYETLQLGSLNSGIFATALERGDIRAMVCGHMHANTFTATYCGIQLCFAGTIGFRCGCVEEVRGARLFTLQKTDEGKIDLQTRFIYANDILC